MLWALAVLSLGLIGPLQVSAGDEEQPVARHYIAAPPAPMTQSTDEAEAKSAGCKSCHTASDTWTMHKTPAVVLGCTDCHGGDAKVTAAAGLARNDPSYARLRD